MLALEYMVDGRVAATQSVQTSLNFEQQIQLFQDALRTVAHKQSERKEWPVDLAVRCRRLGLETVVQYACFIGSCRKKGILKLRAAS